MQISRFVIGACLYAGKWLFLATGLLALAALAVDFLKGAADGRPVVLSVIAVACMVLGGLFHCMGRWFDRLAARAE